MSTDITIYEDDGISVSATMGHWGCRLFATSGKGMGSATVMSDRLITVADVDAIIEAFKRVREHVTWVETPDNEEDT